jgi:hypothetical protein
MRICPTCGNGVPEPEARFCGFCGGAVPLDGRGSGQTGHAPGQQAPAPLPVRPEVRARRPGESAPVPRPVSRPTDSVATSLVPPSVAAEPGGIATLRIKVRNTGSVVDELRISVEGDAAPWAEVDTPVVRLMPGTDGASTIRLKPPIVPLALAGPVSFLVRVQSQEHPAEPATETGVLTVGEIRSLAATIVPATAKAAGSAPFEVRVENRGNVPARVVLAASDPDEALRFELDTSVQALPAGATLRAPLRVAPRAGILLGSPERRGFVVDVTGDAGARTQASATLVQAPRLPSWAPMAGIAAGALVVLAVAGVVLGILPPKAASSPSAAPASAGASQVAVVSASPSAATSPGAATSPTAVATPTPSAAPTATPTEPPTPTPSPTLAPDACAPGYAWRLVNPSDHVCTTPEVAAQVAADNAVAPSRWTTGDFGPHTCLVGYVWRNAFDGDDVCVTGDQRTIAGFDNAATVSRYLPRMDLCIDGYAWREATPEDHVCVEPSTRAQVQADNLAAVSRWVDGAYGPQTCIVGYVWRVAVEGDLVCVTGDQRDQAQVDNAAAASRVRPS